jgi:hypothetical protein
VESKPGLYGLHFDEIRGIRGSMHIALAGRILNDCDRANATKILQWLSGFGMHLHNHHRNTEGIAIPHEVLMELDKPCYVGSFGLEDAWALSPDLEGKTEDEMASMLRQQLEGLLEELRSDVAHRHGGRPGSLSILDKGVWNAVGVIEGRADEWLRRARETDSCADLLYVAQEVHEQVFLIDELFGMGCCKGGPDACTIGGETLLSVIEKVDDLIDWEECGHLRRWMDRAREAQSRSNTGGIGDW